jgi:hypothetical protein
LSDWFWPISASSAPFLANGKLRTKSTLTRKKPAKKRTFQRFPLLSAVHILHKITEKMGALQVWLPATALKLPPLPFFILISI